MQFGSFKKLGPDRLIFHKNLTFKVHASFNQNFLGNRRSTVFLLLFVYLKGEASEEKRLV